MVAALQSMDFYWKRMTVEQEALLQSHRVFAGIELAIFEESRNFWGSRMQFSESYKLAELLSVAGATIGIVIAGAILLQGFYTRCKELPASQLEGPAKTQFLPVFQRFLEGFRRASWSTQRGDLFGWSCSARRHPCQGHCPV